MANITGRNTIFNPDMRYRVIFKFSELVNISGQSLGLSDFMTYYNNGVNTVTVGSLTCKTCVQEMQFDMIDSNCDVNLLGISESNTAFIRIFDSIGILSPDNEYSPYFGALVNGIHVQIMQADAVHSGNDTIWTYSDYCDWYITSIKSELSDGGYQSIQISLQDRLNIIGDMEVTNDNGELASMSGLTGAEVLRQLFNNIKWLGVNLSENTDYIIDSGIIAETSRIFGVSAGSKVRDVINNVCRTLLARCYIRLDGIIYIEKYNKVHTDNVWNIAGMQGLSSVNNSNAMYSDICVKYHTRKQTESKLIKTVEVPSLPSEDYPDWDNITLFVEFDENVASIDKVVINNPIDSQESEGGEAYFNGVEAIITSWTGWGSGCYITVDVRVDDDVTEVSGLTIDIYGHVITGSGSLSKKKKIYEGVVTVTNSTLYYETDQIMSKSDANSLATKVATYFKHELRRKTINDTVYSLHMQVGDKLVISGVNDNFDGDYRITGLHISLGESYSMTIDLTNLH